jgi:hypothetical protein
MSDVNLEQWARRAASDLREFAAAGREAGSPMATTEALLAEIERVLGVSGPAEAPDPYPLERDMIVRAIHQAVSQRASDPTFLERHPIPLWSVVNRLFCYGSSTSAAICRRYGFDPDEMI